MAKHGKPLRARRRRGGVDDSLLIRSAESLGRVIGSLQRQLDDASRHVRGAGAFAKLMDVRARGNGHETRPMKQGTTKAAAPARTNRASASPERSKADRMGARTSKSAGAKKMAKRSRAGQRKSAKASDRT